MEDFIFVDKIRRIIKMRHDDVVAALVSGGVDNMEKYQYMLGQIRTYQYLSQEISTLLDKKEQKNSDGTVISIKPQRKSQNLRRLSKKNTIKNLKKLKKI